MKTLKPKKKEVRMSVRQDLVSVENKIDMVLEIANDMKEEIGDVKSEVRGLKNEMKSEVHGLKNEMKEVKGEVRELKNGLDSVKTEVHGLKTEMDGVKTEVRGLKNELSTQTKLISQLPTREELATLLNMKQQLDRVREVIRERLKVEV